MQRNFWVLQNAEWPSCGTKISLSLTLAYWLDVNSCWELQSFSVKLAQSARMPLLSTSAVWSVNVSFAPYVQKKKTQLHFLVLPSEVW